MDDALAERLRTLAEAAGLDMADLAASLFSGGLPEDFARAVAEVLAETGRFATQGLG